MVSLKIFNKKKKHIFFLRLDLYLQENKISPLGWEKGEKKYSEPVQPQRNNAVVLKLPILLKSASQKWFFPNLSALFFSHCFSTVLQERKDKKSEYIQEVFESYMTLTPTFTHCNLIQSFYYCFSSAKSNLSTRP